MLIRSLQKHFDAFDALSNQLMQFSETRIKIELLINLKLTNNNWVHADAILIKTTEFSDIILYKILFKI